MSDPAQASPRQRRSLRLWYLAAAGMAAGAVVIALWWLSTLPLWPTIWPLLAVVALRMADMCLVVFRTTFVVTGRRTAASTTAAVEGTVWLTAASLVLADLTPWRLGAYAIGVAAGTALGMSIVRALRLGMVTLRVFAPEGTGQQVAQMLRGNGYGATVFAGQGAHGPVEMVLSVLRRREARIALAQVSAVPGVFTAVDSAPGPGSAVSGVAGQPL
jgi:uncharacterized protein YebE (UPF0316 family)